MKSLYEISGAFMEIAADENLTGEEVTEKLQGLEMELDAKVENGIGLIQSLKVTAEGMGAEIKRLNQRKKSIENRIATISDYYLNHLSAMGKTKILTSRGTMTVAKSGGKLPMKIDDKNLVPMDFKKIVYEVDKDKLREALEDGEIISGAHLEVRGNYLKIS